MTRSRRRSLAYACTLALTLTLTPASPAADTPPERRDLAERYERWLDEVDLVITAEERREFLGLEKDYQREAFIRAFWEARDPNPETTVNEFKMTYYARRAEAEARFGSVDVDQARTYIVNGPPASVFETSCGLILWPIEIWEYAYGASIRRPFTVLFYQQYASGPFRIWYPGEGLEVLLRGTPREIAAEPGDPGEFYDYLEERCPGVDLGVLLNTLAHVAGVEGSGPDLATSPPRPDPEWLETFRAYSTDLEPDDITFDAALDFDFGDRHGQRTVVRGIVEIPRTELPEDISAAGFDLYGEVIVPGSGGVDSRLLESFRYRYELDVRADAEHLPLVFERHLRPGDYTVVLKVEEMGTERVARLETGLEVPSVSDGTAPETARTRVAGDETEEAPAVRLVPPRGELLTGAVRVDAEVRGEAVERVSFQLDGEPLLVKTRPPYSVAIDLGDLPRPRTLRAVGLDGSGGEVAADELVLNASPHRFDVRLETEERVEGRMTIRASVEVPEGKTADRIELFVDDRRVATLYQPPYVHHLDERAGNLRIVRAVAHLGDGQTTEDAVAVGDSGLGEELDVDLVELYTVVVDGTGRPVDGLSRQDFTVLEEGDPQRLLRFEHITDLPLHVGLLVDTSASMEESLPSVRRAAFAFFDELLRADDRAAVITFSDRPRIVARFTDDRQRLARALGAIGAERSTTLYDSLVFALHYFQGVQGKRALVILSDGRDRRSRHTLDEARRFAQHAGVAVYTIAFDGGYLDGRRQLAELAATTGGRSYSASSPEDLSRIYEEIEHELRRQYLLVYQAPQRDDDGFRRVEVRVERPGLEARTTAGYFP